MKKYKVYNYNELAKKIRLTEVTRIHVGSFVEIVKSGEKGIVAGVEDDGRYRILTEHNKRRWAADNEIRSLKCNKPKCGLLYSFDPKVMENVEFLDSDFYFLSLYGIRIYQNAAAGLFFSFNSDISQEERFLTVMRKFFKVRSL